MDIEPNAPRVLIVEDEYFLANDLAKALDDAGMISVGPVGTLGKAVKYVDLGQFDFAILDMNLRGEMAFSIADRLIADKVPFLIATGYGAGSIPIRFANIPRVKKPFAAADAIAILRGFAPRIGRSD